MKKNLLLGASLLLLFAAPACNRMEEEVIPADSPVKMRFTAVVEDGDTRTTYQNDKTASWVAGDAISVYVTNGTDGKVVTFTADASLAFEGEVPDGYETIVAGAYPADAAHTFDANGVKTLHMPASYTLAEGADPASILPLAGTYADGVMTFRHPAGALKFTVGDVPADAVRFRFTSAGQKVNGSFALDPALATSSANADKSVDIVFPAAEGTRSFYVPIPAGELAAGSVVSLFDADGNILFQKSVPQAMTVSKNVIKRIAAVDSWKKNEDWQAIYFRDYYKSSDNKIVTHIKVSGLTGYFDMALYTKANFDKSYGSAGKFLTSNYIANKKANGTKPKSGNGNYAYTRLSAGPRVMVIYGLDKDYNFTGEYNIVEFEIPDFHTPDGWSISFIPEFTSNSKTVQAVSVKTNGGSWGFSYMTKEVYASYGSDPAVFITAQREKDGTLRTKTGITLTLGTLAEGDYVFITYGMTEREDENSLRTPTGEYCVLEYSYHLPTEEFGYWLGDWAVTENDGDTPHTDYWTVETDVLNESYKVSGLNDNTTNPKKVNATLDGKKLKMVTQFDFATVTYQNGNSYQLSLVGYNGSYVIYNNYDPYDLMQGEKTDENTAALTGFEYNKYNLVMRVDHESDIYRYGSARTLPATMTRITDDTAPKPDDRPDAEPAGEPAAAAAEAEAIDVE